MNRFLGIFSGPFKWSSTRCTRESSWWCSSRSSPASAWRSSSASQVTAGIAPNPPKLTPPTPRPPDKQRDGGGREDAAAEGELQPGGHLDGPFRDAHPGPDHLRPAALDNRAAGDGEHGRWARRKCLRDKLRLCARGRACLSRVSRS